MEEAKRRFEVAIATGATNLDLSFLKLTSLPEDIFASEAMTSLQQLDISYNQLTSLPENIFAGKAMTNLKTLYICSNNLTSLPENIFAPLTNLQRLYISDNQLTNLPENIFVPLTSLQQLHIDSNQLTNLPEKIFTPLTSLQRLYINENQLSSLPENIFAPLTSLLRLEIYDNQLTSLSENIFAFLTSLQTLCLHENKLTSLPENIFTLLTALQELHINHNQLTSLPLSILDCRRLTYFEHQGMELTLDIRIQRFIDRMRNYKNHGIFTDGQNIHASSIQTSTKQSINALFKDPFDCSKDDIVKECISWSISCLPDLLTYLDGADVHSTLLVSFYDVFVKVFGRIMSHPNKTDIIHRLNDELQESECKCFTGRLTRLVNCLVGFYGDIVIGISDSERISAIILSTLDGREMTDELKKICIDKLKAIDIADEEIEKWLS
jgi:Leucine-rich repeat (LRR) protein